MTVTVIVPLKEFVFVVLPLPSLFKSVVVVVLPSAINFLNSPPKSPDVFPPFVKVFVEFALRAAKEPLVLAALVVSFRTTVKVSPTLRALLSSNKGR